MHSNNQARWYHCFTLQFWTTSPPTSSVQWRHFSLSNLHSFHTFECLLLGQGFSDCQHLVDASPLAHDHIPSLWQLLSHVKQYCHIRGVFGLFLVSLMWFSSWKWEENYSQKVTTVAGEEGAAGLQLCWFKSQHAFPTKWAWVRANAGVEWTWSDVPRLNLTSYKTREAGIEDGSSPSKGPITSPDCIDGFWISFESKGHIVCLKGSI